jgi:hypothetical protein
MTAAAFEAFLSHVNVNKLYSHEASEHARYQLGQQVHAHGRPRLQPQEDDEIQIQQTDG